MNDNMLLLLTILVLWFVIIRGIKSTPNTGSTNSGDTQVAKEQSYNRFAVSGRSYTVRIDHWFI